MKETKKFWAITSLLIFVVLVSYTAVFGQDDRDEPVKKSDSDGPQIVNDPTDQQILDDLIVAGSACIGFDCVNGESFGFDTMRLKENNLRIHFQDTSNSASFPTNDWRITINDSANGGSSYFAVEDATAGRIPFRIMAGAAANSFVVDDEGDVGLGTTTPVTELHLNDGDTPAIRLEQNGTAGWDPYIWDVAASEGYFFIRDVTNNLTQPLKIQAGAPDNSFYVAADGSVTMGKDIGPGGADNFYLDAAGNLTIPGTLTTGSGTVYTRNSQADPLQTQIEAQQSEIDNLRQENADLESRLAELELLVQSLVELGNQ